MAEIDDNVELCLRRLRSLTRGPVLALHDRCAGATASLLCAAGAELASPDFDDLQFASFVERALPFHACQRPLLESAEQLGRRWDLTRQQRLVLALASAGESREQIAQAAGVSRETIKSHLRALLERAGGASLRAVTYTAWVTALRVAREPSLVPDESGSARASASTATVLVCRDDELPGLSKLCVPEGMTLLELSLSEVQALPRLDGVVGIIVAARREAWELCRRLRPALAQATTLFLVGRDLRKHEIDVLHRDEVALVAAADALAIRRHLARLAYAMPVEDSALRRAMSRLSYEWQLTPQQTYVLASLLKHEGETRNLHTRLNLSEATVRSHVSALLRGAGKRTAPQLVATVFMRALLSTSSVLQASYGAASDGVQALDRHHNLLERRGSYSPLAPS